MRVQKVRDDSGLHFLLLDGEGVEVTAVSAFLRHLRARGSSPNTLSAYAYDLLHFFRFLAGAGIAYREFSPRRALDLLEYLRDVPARGRARQSGMEVSGEDVARLARLSPVTVNRVLAAVSSFYEHLILTGDTPQDENPLQKVPDLAASRVTQRYVPFLHLTTRQRPVRRAVRVRAPQRLPRPLNDEQVAALFAAKFITTREYAPRPRARRMRELELAADAASHGWEREVERHRCAAARIEQLLGELNEPLDDGEHDDG
ncbi:MAG TPA: site-specific integrase [Pyrinomonadaceae bacterium]|jgi:hypothetical protein